MQQIWPKERQKKHSSYVDPYVGRPLGTRSHIRYTYDLEGKGNMVYLIIFLYLMILKYKKELLNNKNGFKK